jgi:hypothetical protein
MVTADGVSDRANPVGASGQGAQLQGHMKGRRVDSSWLCAYKSNVILSLMFFNHPLSVVTEYPIPRFARDVNIFNHIFSHRTQCPL